RDYAEDARDVDYVRLGPAPKMRQEGARSVYYAPEVYAHQPRHLRIVVFVELTQQRNTGIVDENAESREFSDGRLRELFDLFGIGDVDAANGDSPRMSNRDFFRYRLKACVVDIGQREIAAASSKFQ